MTPLLFIKKNPQCICNNMTQCFYVFTSFDISEKKEMITSTLHSSYEDKNTCMNCALVELLYFFY